MEAVLLWSGRGTLARERQTLGCAANFETSYTVHADMNLDSYLLLPWPEHLELGDFPSRTRYVDALEAVSCFLPSECSWHVRLGISSVSGA